MTQVDVSTFQDLPFTALMTSGHFLTSQIFAAHINKLMISCFYAMPDSGIPGKRAFDSVVMREKQQLMSKIPIPLRPEEVKGWARLMMSWEWTANIRSVV